MRKAIIQIEIECKLDEEHFAPWEELTPSQQKVFEEETPRCEDSGAMSHLPYPRLWLKNGGYCG